jgi:2-iminobutanoate/2-iminopropanoate deaminase
MFPDDASRPARHTMPLGPDSKALVSCDFTAVLG